MLPSKAMLLGGAGLQRGGVTLGQGLPSACVSSVQTKGSLGRADHLLCVCTAPGAWSPDLSRGVYHTQSQDLSTEVCTAPGTASRFQCDTYSPWDRGSRSHQLILFHPGREGAESESPACLKPGPTVKHGLGPSPP